MYFKNKTAFITGASRGIGKAIALKLAAEGANIIVAAKSVEEDPRLGGTIYSAVEEIEKSGGHGLAVKCDIRDEENIKSVIAQGAEKFDGIDILINNASAINLNNTDQLNTKHFDLMQSINVRGTFLVAKHCFPFLKNGNNPHVITLSPPINLDPKWFNNHISYTITKYSMSMLALGWAGEWKKYKIASNALWPRTTIATAAVKNLLGGDALINMSRTTDIIADSVHYILQQPSATYTGQTLIDEEVLASAGITDLDKYAVVQGGRLYPDLFI
ncbi:MAG: NAD(P)-dependent oxidoreductase [Chitinophagaceae bacterium]|nr:NAD(P)-dependent oxidoreductase [Chitinophagaceae bacterium]